MALLHSCDKKSLAEPTLCVFCCNPGCDGASIFGGPTPTPTPTPTPSPPPEALATVDIACSVYSNVPNRDVASQGDIDIVDGVRDSCKLVTVFWKQTPAKDWCPFILDGTQLKAEYCGPYENYGYMRDDNPYYEPAFQTCSSVTDDCGYLLKENPNNTPVTNNWSGGGHEKLTDRGNPDFITYYMDLWVDPGSVAGTGYTGTAVERKWNLRFLDNFMIWIVPFGGWSDTPMNPRTNADYTQVEMEVDVIAGAQNLLDRCAIENCVLFANIWSDFDSEYFNRPAYSQAMDKVDFALYEQWAYNVGTEAALSETDWLRHVNSAQDIAKNRRAIPVVDGKYGASMWYSLASLLLAKENGKGMIWFQASYPNAADINKMLTLDCGLPVEDYVLVSSSYYKRDWDNCIILVNPKTGSTGSISLGGNYMNLETGETVSSITLSTKTGAILVAQ
jgi:hypothetical protein